MRKKCFYVVALLILIVACSKELVEMPFAGFQKPIGFPEPQYRFSDNEISKDKFELGRKLFYDVRLSRNSTIFVVVVTFNPPLSPNQVTMLAMVLMIDSEQGMLRPL